MADGDAGPGTRPLLALSTALLLGALALSYASALRFRLGFVRPPGAAEDGGGYLDSPYWVGLPRPARRATAALQVVALAGYAAWLGAVAAGPPPPGGLVALHALLLAAEAAWPPAAYAMLHRPGQLGPALLACAPLWVAAAAVVGLLATRPAPAGGAGGAGGPLATFGLLLLAPVVVLADGVGWAAAAIFHARAASRRPTPR